MPVWAMSPFKNHSQKLFESPATPPIEFIKAPKENHVASTEVLAAENAQKPFTVDVALLGVVHLETLTFPSKIVLVADSICRCMDTGSPSARAEMADIAKNNKNNRIAPPRKRNVFFIIMNFITLQTFNSTFNLFYQYISTQFGRQPKEHIPTRRQSRTFR